MSFTDKKITTGDVASYGVQSQPNKLTGTAAQNKAAFDQLVSAVVREKFNAFLDELMGASAAGQIGVDTIGVGYEDYDNLQDVLSAMVAAMVAISQGAVANDSITAAMLKSNSVTTPKLDTGAVTAEKLDPALTYAVVNLTEHQVRPIFIQASVPTSASPNGIYLVTG